MRTFLFLDAIFLAASLASPPAQPDVVLPVAPVVQPPAPQAVGTLVGDQVYPVLCRTDCVVRAYPPGIISQPSSVRRVLGAGKELEKDGNFVDGSKTKSWTGPCTLYFLKAVGKGRVYIDVIPKNFTSEDQIVSFVLDVDAGGAPRPPPVDPPVDPKVDPKVDPEPPEVKSFRVIFVYESSAAMTPAVQRVVFGEKVRTYLDAKTTAGPRGDKGWRRYDKDVVATNDPDPAFRALWEAAKPKITTVPCVVIAVNDKAEIVPFPADEAEAVALFNKYLGK